MAWYGVRMVFRFRELNAYEERISLFDATSEEDAFALADLEAQDYCERSGSVDTGLRHCYTVGKELDLTEVFSLMRTSRRSPRRYLRRFFDSGSERQRWIPE